MSQDARIGRLPAYSETKTQTEYETLLGQIPGLKRLSERQWVYEQEDRWMAIDVSLIGEEGDILDGEGCNVLDTHVPWSSLRGHGAMWAYTQLRLRLAAVFGWKVLDSQSGDVYNPLPLEYPLPLPVLSGTAAKGTVPTEPISWMADKAAVQYRKKDRIAAKSEPRSSYSALVPLDGERVLHGCKGGSYVSSVPGIQIRGGEQLDCLEEVTGIGRVFALREDGRRLLADGPLSQGRRAHIAICGLPPLTVLTPVPLPLSPPFAWIPDTPAFIAAVPRPNLGESDIGYGPPSALVGGNRLPISAEAVDRHAWLRDALNPAVHQLIEVDPERQEWRPLLGRALFAEVFGNYAGSTAEELAVSPDGQKIYMTDHYHTVACFDRTGNRFVWTAGLHDSMRVYSLALSPCGRYLAVGGLADDRHSPESFSLLHAETGEFVYRLPVAETFRSAVYAIAWHPESRYLALGLANGRVVEVGLDGDSRSFKGLKGGVRAICFQGEHMLVTGAEKAVRIWNTEESRGDSGQL
ncbi:WD40 repeat domain-containing protein [Saccharibacillus deserti]|uniref:WD40 repeat domain-containing protein n=1 Tax=Saccharibacillus deserti TaxID=1634444 RepID=UPI0015561CC2|nr:WD40 repeat domain-containing protein [Saccharibacillus deserti]